MNHSSLYLVRFEKKDNQKKITGKANRKFRHRTPVRDTKSRDNLGLRTFHASAIHLWNRLGSEGLDVQTNQVILGYTFSRTFKFTTCRLIILQLREHFGIS